MTRKDLIVGNWKMNGTHLEAIQIVQKLSYRLDLADYDRVDIVVCPPYTALRSVQTVIEADRLRILLGAQNVDWREAGAFTGEVAPGMLSALGVRFVVVGHSERREHLGEDDAVVARKARAVLDAAMTPIVAVGETEDQRSAGATEEVIGRQLGAVLAAAGPDESAAMVIAYEPVWAIGTGRTADPDVAAEAIGFLRRTVEEAHGADASGRVRILYGGSVNPGNIASYMAKRDIDGALVGGASLDPDQFAAIVRYWV